MTEIERGGGEIEILSSPEPQAWSPATVPDGSIAQYRETTRETSSPLIIYTITDLMVLKRPKSQRPFKEANRMNLLN